MSYTVTITPKQLTDREKLEKLQVAVEQFQQACNPSSLRSIEEYRDAMMEALAATYVVHIRVTFILTDAEHELIVNLYQTSPTQRKVTAIKFLRAQHDLGLRDAKDVCDMIADGVHTWYNITIVKNGSF